MTITRTMIVEAENRQSLTNLIDFTLCGGARISRGLYEVTIRKLSKTEVEAYEKECEQERKEAKAARARSAALLDTRDLVGPECTCGAADNTVGLHDPTCPIRS